MGPSSSPRVAAAPASAEPAAAAVVSVSRPDPRHPFAMGRRLVTARAGPDFVSRAVGEERGEYDPPPAIKRQRIEAAKTTA